MVPMHVREQTEALHEPDLLTDLGCVGNQSQRAIETLQLRVWNAAILVLIVGDEVTSLILHEKSETPYVVSYLGVGPGAKMRIAAVATLLLDYLNNS